jgi:coiled-coil domain-containing protein 102A
MKCRQSIYHISKLNFKLFCFFKLERLQRENAEEYGKRERLETDKFALERENKKIRIQIDDLMEQLDRKSQQTSAMANSDVKNLQSELTSRNKVRFKFIQFDHVASADFEY